MPSCSRERDNRGTLTQIKAHTRVVARRRQARLGLAGPVARSAPAASCRAAVLSGPAHLVVGDNLAAGASAFDRHQVPWVHACYSLGAPLLQRAPGVGARGEVGFLPQPI